jgi:DNA invertase Pin-like site-specific DNA recombinase
LISNNPFIDYASDDNPLVIIRFPNQLCCELKVHRRIDELLSKLLPNDIVIASELSRLGRSIKETLNTIETIIQDKQARLILIKQHFDLNPAAINNMANKVQITIFSMLAELERDFISERTKEGLSACAAKGIKLGKPKGVIQASMYDKDKEKILHLYQLGVPIQKKNLHTSRLWQALISEVLYK